MDFSMYVVFLCLAGCLMTARADVCSCAPCSSYASRHDRCECCRYIQTGRKRSDPLSESTLQTDKRDSGFQYLKFETPSSLEGKKAHWLSQHKFENSNVIPCLPTRSRLINSQGSVESDCVESGAGLDRSDDPLFGKIFLDNKRSLRHYQRFLKFVENIIPRRQRKDLIQYQPNPEVLQDNTDLTWNRELVSSKSSSVVPDFRRILGWQGSSKSVLVPRQPNSDSVPHAELVVSDESVSPVEDSWS